MTTPTPSPAVGFAQSFRILIGALLAAPVMVGGIMLFVGTSDEWLTGTPDPMWAGFLVVMGAVTAVMVPTVGYRIPPLERGMTTEEAHRVARERHHAASILRFALADAPFIVGVALAFVDGTYVLLLIGAAISLVLLLLHVWPSRRVVGRTAELLERDGVDSGLIETFGYQG